MTGGKIAMMGLALGSISLLGPGIVAIPAACPSEAPVVSIPLSMGLEASEAEISGLAWYGDELVVMPQFPDRFESDSGGSLFAYSRADLSSWLDDRSNPEPMPRRIPLAIEASESLRGFEGFEAIAFHGDAVFFAVEAETEDGMIGYLCKGRVVGSLDKIEIDASMAVQLTKQTELDNIAYEALFVTGDRVVAIYEANGASNQRPVARVFTTSLQPADDVDVEPVEYRITDVTAPDADGRFWASNYFYGGDTWQTGDCPISRTFGLGESHSNTRTVERIVELQLTADGIKPTDRAPVQLRLGGADRNWEGVARFGDRGFFVATDEHPRSMLAFVPAS